MFLTNNQESLQEQLALGVFNLKHEDSKSISKIFANKFISKLDNQYFSDSKSKKNSLLSFSNTLYIPSSRFFSSFNPKLAEASNKSKVKCVLKSERKLLSNKLKKSKN